MSGRSRRRWVGLVRQGFSQMMVEIEGELCVGAVISPKSVAAVGRGHQSHRAPARPPALMSTLPGVCPLHGH